MARTLAEAGASVAFTSRDPDRAGASAAALSVLKGARHIGLRLDHMKPDDLPTAFADDLELAGRVDILINNGHETNSAD